MICFEPCVLMKGEEELNCWRLHNFILTSVSSVLIQFIFYSLSQILQQKYNHIHFGNIPENIYFHDGI